MRKRWNAIIKETGDLASCGVFGCNCKSFKIAGSKRLVCSYCETSYPLDDIKDIYNIVPNILGRYPYESK